MLLKIATSRQKTLEGQRFTDVSGGTDMDH